MTMLEAVPYALAGQVHEQQICKRIDDLCSVRRDNIVLCNRQQSSDLTHHPTDLFTPV